MLKLKSLGSPAIVAALAVPLLSGANAVAGSSVSARSIEGIWDSTITVKDCATGAVLGPPAKALIVFRRGGSFDVDTTQGRGVFGDIYGLWKYSSGAAFTANAAHLRYNPDNTLAGTNRIQRSVTLAADGASFTSLLTVQVLDTSGNVLNQVCPTEAAVRLDL